MELRTERACALLATMATVEALGFEETTKLCGV